VWTVLSILPLDDELFALIVLEVQVIYRFAVGFRSALLLGVEVREVFDLLPVLYFHVLKIAHNN
jgi:hypothetical protein